jgi:hypothetical protein
MAGRDLRLDRLTRPNGSFTAITARLDVPSGSFFALLGRRLQQTTTLRMVAGSSGRPAAQILLEERGDPAAVPAAGQHGVPELCAVPH